MRELWREYRDSLSGEYRGFDREIASLPGVYQRLLLEWVDAEPAGTIALRPLTERGCEIKRLYVRPVFRGQGLARRLLSTALAEARALGYREVFCDTLPTMRAAVDLYKSFGFEETGPYSETPTPGAIFLFRAL